MAVNPKLNDEVNVTVLLPDYLDRHLKERSREMDVEPARLIHLALLRDIECLGGNQTSV